MSDNKRKHLIYSQTGESLMQDAIENYNIIDYFILLLPVTVSIKVSSFSSITYFMLVL